MPTPTPTPTPRVSATADATPAAAGSGRRLTYGAALARLPKRFQRLLAGGVTQRSAGAERGLAEDERYLSLAISTCAAEPGSATVEIGIVSMIDEPFTVDYVVSGGDEFRVAGTVTVDPDDEFADFVVPGLSRGDYRLDLYEPGGTVALTSDPISVVDCVAVTVSCQAITFANPATNPAVDVVYGTPEEMGSEDDPGALEELTVPPGRSTRVRTSATEIEWFALSLGGSTSEPTVSLAGEGTEQIPVDCGVPISITAAVSCSAAGRSPARITTDVEHPAGQAFRYVIVDDRGERVAADEAEADDSRAHRFSDVLPEAGRYRAELSLSGSADLYDVVEFRVLSCLTITVTCRAVTFTNPAGNPVVDLRLGRPGSDLTVAQADLDSGATHRAPWTRSTLAWTASDYGVPGGFIQEAGRQESVPVPQTCASAVSSPSGAATPPRPREPLAATGSSSAAPYGLVLGVGLSLGGALVLRRRRPRP